jgi:hypothetical protein
MVHIPQDGDGAQPGIFGLPVTTLGQKRVKLGNQKITFFCSRIQFMASVSTFAFHMLTGSDVLVLRKLKSVLRWALTAFGPLLCCCGVINILLQTLVKHKDITGDVSSSVLEGGGGGGARQLRGLFCEAFVVVCARALAFVFFAKPPR